jgi:hypothetical protein
MQAAGLAVALTGLAWLARPERPSAGVPPELACAVRQLRTREPLYHRTVGRLARRVVPTLAARFPRLLGVETRAPLQRLEACHELVAWGPAAAPALPLLVDAFCDPDHDIRAYAFISLVHVQAPAGQVATLVRERSPDPGVQVTHCARLLADEDEMIREYARAMIEVCGATNPLAARAVKDLASRQNREPVLARRPTELGRENP